MATPWFSVIMPMYNRAHTVRRAIDSVLDQGFQDVEILVVDDGSDDDSIQVVESIEDKRVHLFKHDRNRGVCPARNTALDHAQGAWVILLDSDDTLAEGSLKKIQQLTKKAPKEVGRLLFNNRLDDGSFSPQPPLMDDRWVYIDWIQWTGIVGQVSDCVHVIRRDLFSTIRFPDSHAFESKFHYDIAKAAPAMTFGFIAGMHHDDAGNRLTQESPEHRRLRSLDQAIELRDLLRVHGSMIHRHASVKYWNLVGQTASAFFSGGKRWQGARFAIHYIVANPWQLRMWAILAGGLLGWRALAALQKTYLKFKR